MWDKMKFLQKMFSQESHNVDEILEKLNLEDICSDSDKAEKVKDRGNEFFKGSSRFPRFPLNC